VSVRLEHADRELGESFRRFCVWFLWRL